MTDSAQPRAFVRATNVMFALAFCACVLGAYWPTVKLLDLELADLGYQGVWIGGNARRITEVTPHGAADRAGLRVGDVLEFDPRRDADWVLAGYRNMPEAFRATLRVRRADGSRASVTVAPDRVAFLPTANDRLALLARLASLTIGMFVAVFMIWARPGVMTWCLLLAFSSFAPLRPLITWFLAFEATRPGLNMVSVLPVLNWAMGIALVPFALLFPDNTLPRRLSWGYALILTTALAVIAIQGARLAAAPFERDTLSPGPFLMFIALAGLSLLLAIAALAQTYRRSAGDARARLRWVLLGMSAALAGTLFAMVSIIVPAALESPSGGRLLTPAHWVISISMGFLFPLALGVGVLRERVVDIQFAVSRTLVFGAVSTIALIFIAAVHWLLGRLIEQSHLAIGIEGVAAIGLGVVLHRTTHGINLLVDRVLFRKHHQAEERLRRVTAALPYATEERAISEALVTEPARQLKLASAALFYRNSADGPLDRVLSIGWSGGHATTLEADCLLVRYLQAEHTPLRLDDLQMLPTGMPGGAALPVLAIPIVMQHVLIAVVLYGSHVNSTLLDPDEVELLQAIAKAAATSHQQVRIATLARENAALKREAEMQKARNAQLEASIRLLEDSRVASQPHIGQRDVPR